MIKSINIKIIILLAVFVGSVSGQSGMKEYSTIISKLENQLIKKIQLFDGRYPEYTIDGKWKYREKVNWFSGFAAGELFKLAEITENTELIKSALEISDHLIDYAGIDYTHDMGFIFIHSVINAYKKTGDKKYKNAALKAAEMLAKRFNDSGNFIRAWGKLGSENKAGVVIIDTMMNLELLFWAAREFGIPEYYDIAYKHALTCLNEHVRDDFTSFHVVEFDPGSGKLIKKYTHQGFADSSTWARGQAWGIYGFAESYKNTGDERFLNASKKMADYFISKLPADYVPYWDLDLSGKEVLRDASAGAIAASGLDLLAEQCADKCEFEKYKLYSNKITESLLENYTFLNSNRETEEGLLIHTIYNYHSNWGVDESFPCGDYYFIEAVNKYIKRNRLANKTNQLREKINLNQNWFYLEDNTDYCDLIKSPKTWVVVDLPHSWNKYDAVDQEPGYRRDASWYQKELFIPIIQSDKKYFLEFEAVNIKSEVYVNNKLAGKHLGGYIGFKYDITQFLTAGKNEILVKADNSIDRSIIPSQKSDFFIYGGITRDVWLDVIPKSHLDSLRIVTQNVSNNSAELSAAFSSENIIENSKAVISINDPWGKVILEKEYLLKKNNLISLPKISDPVLWSVDEPNLYSINIKIKSNNEFIDSISESFGLRWFEFKEHGAFYLNGKRLKLRGTHRHEEFAGLANALPNEMHWNEMKMIKDMGANFVRLAHYPQDPVVYKACDELGLLVWDELPWCRGGVGDEGWQNTTKHLFKEQIYQNFNHPSIIIWSVGNEVYWLPEYENGDDLDLLRKFTKELNDIAHTLDPSRVTSIRKFYEGSDIVDVFSPSIWAGWYSGVYKSYDKALDEAIAKYKRFFHAEYGGSSHLGRHSETPITGDGILNPDEWSEDVNQVKVKNIAKIGDWSESYIVDLFDWHLMVSESKDNFTGNAQWAFKDFATPLRPENSIPYMNQKGLVDREGNPKDAYYVFKSYWNKKDKFVYIQSATWTERYGTEDAKREVSVFSNCEEVELILNGESEGIRKKNIAVFPASGLSWNVQFKEGENELIAIGKDGDKSVTNKLVINYLTQKYGKPEEIVLEKKRLPNSNYLIVAKVVDSNGNICADFNERIYFSQSGSGKLLTNYGTYDKSDVIEFANGKASIQFKAVPFKKATIEARTQDFKGAWIQID